MASKHKTASTGRSKRPGSPRTTSNATAMLKADHRKVEHLFRKYKAARSTARKGELARQVCTELVVHTQLEEQIFYPACHAADVESDLLDEAQVEHDTVKMLIGELMTRGPDSEFYDAKMTVLSEYVKHHVGEEEKPSDGLFAKARAAKVDMNALGRRMRTHRQELLQKAGANGLRVPQPRALGSH